MNLTIHAVVLFFHFALTLQDVTGPITKNTDWSTGKDNQRHAYLPNQHVYLSLK